MLVDWIFYQYSIKMRLLQGYQGVDRLVLHQRMMVIGWLVASNVGLWAQAFKQYRWANYLHLYFMIMIAIVTWMSGFIAIIEFGLPLGLQYLHQNMGLAIMIMVFLQTVGGILSWSIQSATKTSPTVVSCSNLFHRIFGWALMILVMVQLLMITKDKDRELFNIIIGVDVGSYSLYILIKIFRRSMQGYTQIQTQDIEGVPVIKSLRQLAKYHGNYFIFADKVYDIENVITSHPGGYELIKSIGEGKLTDLFMDLNLLSQWNQQEFTVIPQQVSQWLVNLSVFLLVLDNMAQINDVTLERCALPCKSEQIYAPYLISKSKPYLYQGYEDISQIGKYYAVTIQGRKTRLYTLVNFIHPSNLQLMSRIIGKNFNPKSQTQISLNHSLSSNIVSPDKQIDANSIPLLIKKYQSGDFTQTFLSQNFNGQIKISKPRGNGMSLSEMPNGRIIMLAGGTGLHPFCDLIDLLYKETLVQQNQPLSKEIISQNPLVRQRTLTERWKFCIYIAVEYTDEIHDLTASQLNHLSRSRVMEVFLRAKHRPTDFSKLYPDISIIDKRFQHYVAELAPQIDKISQIYVCGPRSMTNSLYKCFGQTNISGQKFKTL